MIDKYQYIRDQEKERLRKKLAKIDQERDRAMAVVIKIGCLLILAIYLYF